MTAAEICVICARAAALGPLEPPGDMGNDDMGVPRWHSYETKIWEIGEDIRQILKGRPSLRASPEVQQCLLAVAEDRRLRRGRQPFIMNLGYRSAAAQAPRVARLLEDTDVSGHALDTLIKMRAPGFEQRVLPLVGSEFAWVRRLAKKYLTAYGG